MADWSGAPVLACRKCGTELPSDAKFCWQCGKSVYGDAEDAAVPDTDAEAAAVTELHRLISKGFAPGTYPDAYFDDFEIGRLLQKHPMAAIEPFGKERVTALHRLATGNPRMETGSNENLARGIQRQGCFNTVCDVPGIDPNVQDWEGKTPLHHAINCCETLPIGNQDWNADPRDRFVSMIQEKVIDTLLKLGADPNARDGQGVTPVHVAAEKGRHYLLALLFRHGGDPEALDNRGWTPTHYATQNRYPLVLKHLQEEIEDRGSAGRPAPLPKPIS